jgi:hypothetical protein
VYSKKSEDCQKIKKTVVKSLRTAFLHSEVMEDKEVDYVEKLGDSLTHVVKAARAKNVLVERTSSKTGKGRRFWKIC